MFEKIKKDLLSIENNLSELKNDWFVIGSWAMILGGVPIENAEDIDLLTSNEDAEFLKIKWENHVLKSFKPKHEHKFRSNFARVRIGETLIEIMGNLEVFSENQWGPLQIVDWQIVIIDKLKIKIPTLNDQLRIFRLFGREKDLAKADRIIQYLNAQ